MLVNLVDKQRRAVSVVKTTLLGAGITGRSVSVNYSSSSFSIGTDIDRFAVFVSSPIGENTEPYFETGESLIETVRKMVTVIKGDTHKNGTKTDDQSEVAPF